MKWVFVACLALLIIAGLGWGSMKRHQEREAEKECQRIYQNDIAMRLKCLEGRIH